MRQFRIGQRITFAFAALIMFFSLSAGTANAAETLSGCHYVSCINVYMGGKNYSAHSQWAKAIEVISMGSNGTLEAWGSGFYFRGTGSYASWTINRWVPSGSYICGAVTQPNVPRRVACIGIHV